MDKLQQAFEVLGGVEWKNGFGTRMRLWNGIPIGMKETTFAKEFYASIGTEKELRRYDSPCDPHEASALLLKAMLEKAEEKWPELEFVKATFHGWRLYKNIGMTKPIGNAETLFDALLAALSQ